MLILVRHVFIRTQSPQNPLILLGKTWPGQVDYPSLSNQGSPQKFLKAWWHLVALSSWVVLQMLLKALPNFR